MEILFTSTNLTSAIKTLIIKKSLSTVIIEKRNFIDMQSLFVSQKRQEYDPITFTQLKKLI